MHRRDACATENRVPSRYRSPMHARPSRLGHTALGKVFTIVSWLAFAPIGAAALAWLFAGFAWKIDLVANLGAQCLLVTLPFLALWTLTRRWTLACLTLAACLSHACAIGMHRALWLPTRESAWAFGNPTPPPPAPHTPADDGLLRIVHFNASSYNSPQELIERIRTCGADVVSWTEISWSMYATMVDTTPLEEEYPYRVVRDFVPGAAYTGAGWGFILSRLPMEPFPLDGVVDDALKREYLACVLTVPGKNGTADTRVGVLALHPLSPRTEERWVMGNIVNDAAVEIVDAMRGEGLEVIVLADLNSTPSGVRSHRLCGGTARGGLSRGKPVFEFVGTYPAKWAWPWRVAIDDVFFSEGLALRSWRLGEPMGSDHVPVYVEIAPTE